MMKATLTTSALTALVLLCGTTSAQQAQTQVQPGERGQLQSGEETVPARPGDGPQRRGGGETGFYRASELIGTSVRGEEGQELGKIEDLLIERRNQRISHFILGGQGAAANAQEGAAQGNVRVVPWSVAQPRISGEERAVTIPMAAQRFQEAPTYTWQEIQAGPRGAWYNDVNTFYGVQPRTRGAGRVEVERDGDVDVERRPNRRGGNVEFERDGSVDVEGRPDRRAGNVGVEGRPGQPGVDVEVERDGDIDVDND